MVCDNTPQRITESIELRYGICGYTVGKPRSTVPAGFSWSTEDLEIIDWIAFPDPDDNPELDPEIVI